MAKARQNATPLVSICYALVVFAALNWAVFGTGAIRGSHLGQIAGGWLEADATVMAVPLVAQLPWFALMAGLGIYAVWQCMPTARHTDLHGKLRPWVLALVLLMPCGCNCCSATGWASACCSRCSCSWC